jgi:peptide-methionine (R)-S-oxide reductase
MRRILFLSPAGERAINHASALDRRSIPYPGAMPKIEKSEKEWRDQLTPEQYEVIREGGTERAFTGPYVDEKAEGMYRCVGCGTELFSSDTKFDSGTGWPSFTEPANLEHVELRPDNSHFMKRTEVVCKNCEAHLGHVFDDGPTDRGGQRYCINGCALTLDKDE